MSKSQSWTRVPSALGWSVWHQSSTKFEIKAYPGLYGGPILLVMAGFVEFCRHFFNGNLPPWTYSPIAVVLLCFLGLFNLAGFKNVILDSENGQIEWVRRLFFLGKVHRANQRDMDRIGLTVVGSQIKQFRTVIYPKSSVNCKPIVIGTLYSQSAAVDQAKLLGAFLNLPVNLEPSRGLT